MSGKRAVAVGTARRTVRRHATCARSVRPGDGRVCMCVNCRRLVCLCLKSRVRLYGDWHGRLLDCEILPSLQGMCVQVARVCCLTQTHAIARRATVRLGQRRSCRHQTGTMRWRRLLAAACTTMCRCVSRATTALTGFDGSALQAATGMTGASPTAIAPVYAPRDTIAAPARRKQTRPPALETPTCTVPR